MHDLDVSYLGVRFKNPLVVTACSLTSDLDSIMRLIDAGAGGIVTKAISTELLPPQELAYLEHRDMQFVLSDQRILLEDALEMIAEIKKRSDVPVVANLLGLSDLAASWSGLAERIEASGVDLVEVDLNAHVTEDQGKELPAGALDFDVPSIGGDEGMVERVVAAVKGATSVPVVTKISPLTTDLVGIAKAAIAGGTDGLSLLNTLGGLPGVDIYRGGKPHYEGFDVQGSSALFGEAMAPGSMWATFQFAKLFDRPLISGGGVMTGEQAIERVFLGAHLAGVCATLYKNGAEHLSTMLRDMEKYMVETGQPDLDSFRGQALAHIGRSPFWDFSSQG